MSDFYAFPQKMHIMSAEILEDVRQEGDCSQMGLTRKVRCTSEHSKGHHLISISFFFSLVSFSFLRVRASLSHVETTEVLPGAHCGSDTALPLRIWNAWNDLFPPQSIAAALPPAHSLSRAALLLPSISADTSRKHFSALSSCENVGV